MTDIMGHIFLLCSNFWLDVRYSKFSGRQLVENNFDLFEAWLVSLFTVSLEHPLLSCGGPTFCDGT